MILMYAFENLPCNEYKLKVKNNRIFLIDTKIYSQNSITKAEIQMRVEFVISAFQKAVSTVVNSVLLGLKYWHWRLRQVPLILILWNLLPRGGISSDSPQPKHESLLAIDFTDVVCVDFFFQLTW